jgi:hypothetical protein
VLPDCYRVTLMSPTFVATPALEDGDGSGHFSSVHARTHARTRTHSRARACSLAATRDSKPGRRSGLHLHPSSVPYFCYEHNHIDSYLLDFYKNDGDSVGLEKFNRIRKTDKYDLLEEFTKIVGSVIAVLEELENMCKEDPGRFNRNNT